MKEKVLDLLEEICEDSVVREDMDVELFESGLLDSMGLAELLAGLEERAGIVIAPSEVDRDMMDTPGKILALCSEKLQ